MKYRILIMEIWAEGGLGDLDRKGQNHVFRRNRPEETFKNDWLYKVWRQEIRRIQGLANGSIRKRTLDKNKVMPSMQQWARDHGLKLKGKDHGRTPEALSLD